MSEKYPLEQVVAIKKRRLEEAEKVLAEKKRLLQQEEEKLKEAEKKRDEVKNQRHISLTQLREKLDQGTTSDKIQQLKQYIKHVDELLKVEETKVAEQKKKVVAAEEQVESARKELFKKQKDMEKLSIHHGEWEREKKIDAEKKEDVVTDEIGNSMHVLRKKEKKKRSKTL